MTAADGQAGADPGRTTISTNWTAPSRLGAVGAGIVLIYVAAFPHRLEYPAHMVAGCGLAGMAMAGTYRLVRRPELQATIVLLSVLAAAFVAEVTFAGPPIDLLDMANTVLGGALGVAAVAGWQRSSPPAKLFATGLALAVLGLLIRYPIQSGVKNIWWFGP